MDEVTHFFHDNCSNVYAPINGRGDIGQNIADHPESDIAGFKDIEHFLSEVERVGEEVVPRSESSVENKSSALAYLLANNSQADHLGELQEVALEAQNPEDYGNGFIWLNAFMSDAESAVVTAGWKEPAYQTIRSRMSEDGYEQFTPEVIGAEIAQNGKGLKVERYCAGDRKIDAIKEDYGLESLEQVPSIATGNSESNDGPMLLQSRLGIGRGSAKPVSDIFTEEDYEFWSRGTASVIADALMKDSGESAEVRALEYLESASKFGYEPELEDVELGGQQNDLAYEVLDIYETVQDGFQDNTYEKVRTV